MKGRGTMEETASVPRLVEFESNQNDYERLDEIQALNTALCFLCSINANVTEVEAFLLAYPEALLLEGTSRLSEESARYILFSHACSCSDNSPCKRNRQAILDCCLSQDFLSFHRQKQLQQMQQRHCYSNEGNNPNELAAAAAASDLPNISWNEFRQDLILLEQDIRQWRREEWNIRQKLMELTVQKYEQQARQAQLQLQANRNNNNNNNERPSPLKCLLLCALAPRRVTAEVDDGVGHVLPLGDDNHVQEGHYASARLLRERHRHLLMEIKKARQIQFHLLSQTFDGTKRHACVSSQYLSMT
ncbi:hypothetical protein ACA910_001075 [Epithemia clementina (nom. ined.)]